MKISDLTVEVRNSSLARVGQILPGDLVGLQLALRFNKVGAWKLTLRADHPLVDTLRAPGAGLIVTGPTGVLLSGPTTSATATKTADDPTGVWDISGADDTILLGERLAYPVPSTADLSLQTSAYDTRTGAAETVVKAYVNANMGPSAPVARKVSSLTIDTDLGRGLTVTGNARFDTLGALVETLLLSSALGFDIVQSGAGLKFMVFAPTDRSTTIRMDVDNLRLSKSEYSYTSPGVTRVIVGGSGEGSARVLLERSSSASTSAESAWGRRIEAFQNESNTADTVSLQTAADAVLAEKGKTVEGISVTPSDDQTMRYGTDWGLGDKVTVVVGSSQVVQVVTEVAIVVTGDGIRVGATVGDPVTASGDSETAVIDAQTSQEARIAALETNDTTPDGGVGLAKLAASVAAALNPTGSIHAFAGSAAPTGYVLCDGSAVSRTTYAALFAVTSTLYGAGDGSTTFNLPNLQGRVPVGKNAATFGTLGATGGAETHTLTEAQIPSHTHDIYVNTFAGDRQIVFGGQTGDGAYYGINDDPTDGSLSARRIYNKNTGGGQAHNNLQPYQVVNYIIKT